MISLICIIESETKQNKTHIKRDQICGYHRWGQGELDEGG